MRQLDSTWVVTGAAGFIGMHLVHHLLKQGYRVRGVDNFITGKRQRLNYLREILPAECWRKFLFIEGDLTDSKVCAGVCDQAEVVLHQAALGSVPRSIKDPLNTHRNNVDAFINLLLAAKDKKVKRFVFASSSSVYGDHPALPKVEDQVGVPLSPYAATKRIGEIYALAFQNSYAMETIGLRYFNVFGPAQDPGGPYAAVIPLWIQSLLKGEAVSINGDGSHSRDFSFVDNVVQANMLAALAPKEASGQIYNVACGDQLNLNELYRILKSEINRIRPGGSVKPPVYREKRPGDIPHSLANCAKALKYLGYRPAVNAQEGLVLTVQWFSNNTNFFD